MRRCINKVIVVVTFFITVTTTSFAQKSFTNVPGDTLTDVITLGEKKVLDIKQAAMGSDTLYLAWKKVSVYLPNQWTGSICDNGTCYATLQDTGSMATVFPGEYGFLSLHISTLANPGIAVIRYAVWDVKRPAQIDTVTWVIQAFSTSVNNLPEKSPQVFSSNKVLFFKDISIPDFRTVTIYNMSGQLIISQKIETKEKQINMSFCNDGIYIVNLSGTDQKWKVLISN